MLRRAAALPLFVSALALSVACGRQVTPEPTASASNLAGRIVLRFGTTGPMDFTHYTYAIVIDTCGNGPPYPNVYATTNNNYSYAFLVSGPGGGTVSANLEQYLVVPGSSNPLNPQPVVAGAPAVQLLPNSNQQNSEFQLTFERTLLNNPLGAAHPCPGTAANPAPTATGAKPMPGPTATTAAQETWSFNFFTIDNTRQVVVDSLGGGPSDASFPGVNVDTATTNQYFVSRSSQNGLPSDPAAQIQGNEIDTYQ